MQTHGTPWRLAEVVGVVTENPRAKTLLLEVPGWGGHRAGQHVDVRLTAPDGYTAQRSYSVASAPEDGRLALTVDRLDEGEVSPYLTGVLAAGTGWSSGVRSGAGSPGGSKTAARCCSSAGGRGWRR